MLYRVRPLPQAGEVAFTDTPMTKQQTNAEVISIGDEMTSGARVDTNAAWLSQRLSDLGVLVEFHSTVGDTLSHNIDVFRTAVDRADLIVATGGLGPTEDDLTREALAEVSGQPLEFRQSAMDHIQALFARHDFEMPKRNRVQAMFPTGSEDIFNPHGTAPGIDISIPRAGCDPSRIFALPGVPAEMKRMFDETVAPRIVDRFGSRKVIRQHVMKLFGIGESEMERRLGDMISRDRQPRVGITVSAATISLRISAMTNSDDECQALIDQTRLEVLEKVPEYHFGDGENFEQHHSIDQSLSERNEKLVVVELGHATMLGNLFASLGSESCLRGSLGFDNAESLLKHFQSASLEEAMAKLKDSYQADWGLLIDQYPTTDLKSVEARPKTTVQLSIVKPDGEVVATERTLSAHPDIVHAIIAKATMAKFRKILRGG
jgi:nicotinamide-nucleotide amidase